MQTITTTSTRQYPHAAWAKIEWKDEHGKNHFAYVYNHSNEWAHKNNLPYQIELGNTQALRYVRLAKTRTYICVDEDENGLPVVDTWVTKITIYEA